MPKGIYRISDMVEKPEPADSPSNMAIFGRYILLPEYLKVWKIPILVGQIQSTDAVKQLLKHRDIYARIMNGQRYDVGDKQGFFRANIEFALWREDMQDEFLEYLKALNSKGYEVKFYIRLFLWLFIRGAHKP